jgi:peptide chain release factor 2
MGYTRFVKTKEDMLARIAEIEGAMLAPNFWSDPKEAQALIKEMQDLKVALEGGGKYDKGNAVMTIVAGAGGDDAEDWARMLYEMYLRFAEKKGFSPYVLYANENDHGGFRNLSVEFSGKHVYGTLKNESGVHRLVRISPFGAKGIRQTSFALVEFVPQLPELHEMEIPETDLDVQFTRSGGPGGQNVNKRETAVRIVHIPTNLSVHVTSERSQVDNRKKGMEILKGKLFLKQEEDRKREEKGLAPNKTASIEWGSQIRSYVLHPYKMVKDHRTEMEVSDAEGVLAGALDKFIDAEKEL